MLAILYLERIRELRTQKFSLTVNLNAIDCAGANQMKCLTNVANERKFKMEIQEIEPFHLRFFQVDTGPLSGR